MCCVFASMYADVCTLMQTHISYTHIFIYIYMHIHQRIYVNIQAYHIHVFSSHIYIHIYMHIYIHTNTYTYKQVQQLRMGANFKDIKPAQIWSSSQMDEEKFAYENFFYQRWVRSDIARMYVCMYVCMYVLIGLRRNSHTKTSFTNTRFDLT